jgi:hypothetical protein
LLLSSGELLLLHGATELHPVRKKGDITVKKTSQVQKPVGDPFVCFELCFLKAGNARELVLLASIAGRDGSAVYRWTLNGYLPTAAQVTEMVSTMSDLATSGTILFLGQQEVLPLG